MLVHRLSINQAWCFGATLGQDHLEPLRERLTKMPIQSAQLVVLDFAGIEVVNASYLKATSLWLLRCGMLQVEIEEGRRNLGAPAILPALNVCPLVASLSSEVAEEFDTLLRSERLPFLEAVQWERESILKARCWGPLDHALQNALEALSREGTSTATELCEKYPQRPSIKPTAWNNRLAELYRLRLVRRDRAGRQWLYSPISREVIFG